MVRLSENKLRRIVKEEIKNMLSEYNESWYVTAKDLATADLHHPSEIIAGPFDSKHEAEKHLPEDGDGYEYAVELLSDYQADNNYR